MKENSIKVKRKLFKMMSTGDIIADVVIMVLLLLVAFISFIPLWHVVMSSISDGQLLMSHKGVVWAPLGEFNLNGYKLIFRNSSVIRSYLNTIIYVVGGTALGLVMNVAAGYILSRNTRFKPFMILFFVITTMFNGGTIPTYLVIRALGMTGTPLALIIPGATNAMFMLYMMNAYLAIDRAYEEAAAIDGAGHIQIMFQILLPQAKGMAIVTAVQTAIMKWNSWFEASIYVPTQKDLWPLQLWVKELTANTTEFLKSSNPDYSQYLIQYAVIVIATVPLLACMPLFIEKLEKGIASGGVKG